MYFLYLKNICLFFTEMLYDVFTFFYKLILVNIFSGKYSANKLCFNNFSSSNSSSSSSSTIIILRNIFLSQFLQVKPNFYYDGSMWSPLRFFLYTIW